MSPVLNLPAVQFSCLHLCVSAPLRCFFIFLQKACNLCPPFPLYKDRGTRRMSRKPEKKGNYHELHDDNGFQQIGTDGVARNMPGAPAVARGLALARNRSGSFTASRFDPSIAGGIAAPHAQSAGGALGVARTVNRISPRVRRWRALAVNLTVCAPTPACSFFHCNLARNAI